MKPWLLLNPKWAHKIAPALLPIYASVYSWYNDDNETPSWRSLNWRNLSFKNPLGIAGGVDKNAEQILQWWKLGVGFVEIGTVTPEPQEPNPGEIIDRDIKNLAVWNKMGFPNNGALAVRANLTAIKDFQTPLFINIGKNRQTANAVALQDYIKVIDILAEFAGALVINVSSPNTQGLRDLQGAKYLGELINGIKSHLNKINFVSLPVLLKLSPDLTHSELRESIEIALENKIDGFILTNTTTSRPTGLNFSKEGGLSGLPLADLSKQALKLAHQIIQSSKNHNDILLISAGGVMRVQDVQERLDLGANLVQVYSALIFEGPGFFRKVAQAHAQ